MATSVEVLIDDLVNVKGHRMLVALHESAHLAGLKSVATKAYRGQSYLLVLYGIGSPIKMPIFNGHIKSGRHAIGIDLGYYGRGDNKSYPIRITIDAPHPQRLMSDHVDPYRWENTGRPLRDDFNPDGHIVLCGMGRKSRVQFGIDGTAWERAILKRIRSAYPGVNIIYRPKAGAMESLGKDIKIDPLSSIEKVIAGARLVVVRHSNVAIDACIAGVPVVCEDGAASKLYGADLCNPVHPSPEQRLQFLQSLAHWQYRPEESLTCWRHILQFV